MSVRGPGSAGAPFLSVGLKAFWTQLHSIVVTTEPPGFTDGYLDLAESLEYSGTPYFPRRKAGYTSLAMSGCNWLFGSTLALR